MSAIALAAAEPQHQEIPHLPQTNPVFLVKDDDIRGERAYYFVRVDRRRLPQFLAESRQTSAINLADYGEILFSAYGEHPSAYVEAYMREHYGWEG